MNWLKNVILDIVITAVIGYWVFVGAEWAYWVIVIYTPLMILMKIAGLSSGVSMAAAHIKDAAPNWFFHLLYAANFILLLVGRQWLIAAGWAVIWVLSAAQDAKKRPGPKKSEKGKRSSSK